MTKNFTTPNDNKTFSDELKEHMMQHFPNLTIGESNRPPYPETFVAAYEDYKKVEQELLDLNVPYIKFHTRGYTVFRPDIEFMSKAKYIKSLQK